jgi:hypothetical protein
MRFVNKIIIVLKNRANIPLSKESSMRIPAYKVQKLWAKKGDFLSTFLEIFKKSPFFCPFLLITFVPYMLDASSTALSIEVIWLVLKSIR